MTPEERRLYIRGYSAGLAAERLRHGLCPRCGEAKQPQYRDCRACRIKRSELKSGPKHFASAPDSAHTST